MYEIAEKLVKDVEEGRMGRREAVSRLVAVAAAAFAGSAGGAAAAAGTGAPTFQSVGLNHVALNVTDIARSSEFYQKHLGLKVLRESSHNAFLGAGGNNFVALFRSQNARMNHYAYTIDGYDAGEVVKKLDAEGLEPHREEDRVYFNDADGLQVQLTGEWNDYPGPR